MSEFEQWFFKKFGHSFGGVCDEDIVLGKCWVAAQKDEREACAKVCETPVDEIQITDDCSDMIYMEGHECATAIRARTDVFGKL